MNEEQELLRLRRQLDQIIKPTTGVEFRDRIYVIESPSPEDLLEGRHEGEALFSVLRLAEIDVVYFLAANEEMFNAAFDKIETAILAQPDFHTAMPFIHLSAHGCEEGLELTDGDTVFWEKLHNRLKLLHTVVGPLLVPGQFNQNVPKASVCLSSCGAFQPFVDSTPAEVGYQAAIGPIKDVGWCEALIAFSTFYYQTGMLQKAFHVAVTAMNLACGAAYSGEGTFHVHNPHEFELKGSETETSPSDV